MATPFAGASEDALMRVDLDGAGRTVAQVTPTFESHDAISNEALLIRDSLRRSGFRSDIYAPFIEPAAAAHARPFRAAAVAAADLVVVHFGIGSRVTEAVAALPCRRALWYHNITPARFFRPYSARMTLLLEEGRAQLALAERFDSLIADSAFNVRDLELRIGTRLPIDVVPFAVDARRFDAAPQPTVARPLGVRWLSVGRVAPSKGLLRCVRAFARYARVHPDSQLVIAGPYQPADPFYLRLQSEIDRLRLERHVVFTGALENAQLRALFESSDIYVTLSEHEGFCVPIVEAMFFDVPVVASAAGAIPETLGEAAITVGESAGAAVIAALVDAVLTGDGVRRRLLDAQRRRRDAFRPQRIGPALTTAIRRGLARSQRS